MARLLSEREGRPDREEARLWVAPQVHAAQRGRAERADLGVVARVVGDGEQIDRADEHPGRARPRNEPGRQLKPELHVLEPDVAAVLRTRSEEHTSELQSRT